MTAQPGQLTLEDILQQPAALQAVMESFAQQVKLFDMNALRAHTGKHWIFTGCGTTYALSLSMAMYYRHYGMQATALPASEIKFYPEILPPGEVTLAAFSRSGESSETLWAVEAFREQRPSGTVLALTVNPASNLARSADVVLDVSAARDRSTVETGSFSGMMLAAQLLNAALLEDQPRRDRLENGVRKLVDLNALARELAGRILAADRYSRFFFLGGGPMYGIASQASFMIKECSADWVEAFHPLEFRHGPRTCAVEGALVVLFLSPSQAEHDLRLVQEMQDQGAKTVVLLENQGGYDLSRVDYVLETGSGVGFWEGMLSSLPFVQWLAYMRAIKLGMNPDHPLHLTGVTIL